MTEQGYVIGFRELHEQITRLDQKIENQLGAHAIRLAELTVKVQQMEDRGQQRWQANLAMASSAVAVVTAFVAPLILR